MLLIEKAMVLNLSLLYESSTSNFYLFFHQLQSHFKIG